MEILSMRKAALAFIASSCLTGAASAQIVPALNTRPEPTTKIDTIPAPKDVPYPGTIRLTVDASDVTRGIFRIHEQVPVASSGDFVMLYPKWIPGGHTPRGDIKSITGFRPSAKGKPLQW